MKRLLGVVATLALLALDVYLCKYRWNDMLGNLEAQVVIITPAFVVSHVLHKRRSDRQHAERMAAHDANAAELAAHREEMKAVVEKVGEMHELSIEGRLPARIVKP